MQVAIIGLGLIGGSMALALQNDADFVCWAVDTDADTRAAALAAGAVTAAYADISEAPLEQAGLVILCLHPQAAADCLRRIAPRLTPGTVVTDVCGIKRPICAAAKALPAGVCFIGGHPMAGKEKGGFAHASAALCHGAHYLLTPGDDTPPEATALLCDLAQKLGCRDVILTTPEAHDINIAYTSQMMHVLALAVCEQQALPDSKGFEGNSFRGTTRVAAMDVDLWLDLFWQNRDALAGQIGELEEKLAAYRALLSGDDPEALRARMTAAAARKEEWNDA